MNFVEDNDDDDGDYDDDEDEDDDDDDDDDDAADAADDDDDDYDEVDDYATNNGLKAQSSYQEIKADRPTVDADLRVETMRFTRRMRFVRT